MSAITRDNVQHHCRTCLTNLEAKVDEIGLPRMWYHVETTENLANWINSLTSLRVLSTNYEYPQFVCQECYVKFKEFCSFQELVWKAAEKLDKIFADRILSRELDVTRKSLSNSIIKPELTYEIDEDEESNSDNTKWETSDEINGFLDEDCDLKKQIAAGVLQDDGVEVKFETFDTELIHSNINDFEDSNEVPLMRNPILPVANKIYKCEQCNRSYHHKYTYIAHVRQDHHGVSHAFECDYCHKSYTMFCNLYRHMRLEHNESLRQMKCKYQKCNRSFRHLEKLHKHYEEYHNQIEPENYIRPPSPPDSTLLLPELLQTPNNLDAPKRFKCTLCSDSFETLYNLKIHMSEHRNEMKYICNICGCRKISQLKLDEHYATVHDPKNAYPCKICHKVFKSKSHVSVHILSVHKGLRPFACHFCPSQFAAKNTLKIHERIHTGEKPFACEICGRRFTQLTPMKKHRITHEKEQKLQSLAAALSNNPRGN